MDPYIYNIERAVSGDIKTSTGLFALDLQTLDINKRLKDISFKRAALQASVDKLERQLTEASK